MSLCKISWLCKYERASAVSLNIWAHSRLLSTSSVLAALIRVRHCPSTPWNWVTSKKGLWEVQTPNRSGKPENWTAQIRIQSPETQTSLIAHLGGPADGGYMPHSERQMTLHGPWIVWQQLQSPCNPYFSMFQSNLHPVQWRTLEVPQGWSYLSAAHLWWWLRKIRRDYEMRQTENGQN